MPSTYIELFPVRKRNPDGSQQYRWRAKSGNHKVIDNPGQSYSNPSNAIRAARRTHGDDVIIKRVNS